MRRVHQVTAIAVGVATLGGGFIGGREVMSNDGKESAAAALAADVTPQSLADAAEICDVDPYGFDQYQAQVGPNLISNIGTKKDAAGHSEFASTDAVETSKAVATAIAPNNAALGVVATILNGEVGISQEEVARDGLQLAESMQENPKTRKDTCAAVIARILQTPLRRQFNSNTGKITEFKPSYEASMFNGIIADSRKNSANVDVFTIDAVAGSPKEALQKDISNGWGITAEGKVIKKAEDEGQVKVDVRGKPVKASPNTGTTIVGGQQQNKVNGGGGRGNNAGGGEPHGQGEGCTGEAGDGCQGSGPGNGRGPGGPGGGPGTTTGNTTPNTGPVTTVGNTTTTAETTTTIVTTTSKPAGTTTTRPNTTTTEDKGEEPPADCDNNPFDPRC